MAALSANLCLDDLQQNNDEPYNLGVYSCHRPEVTRSQFFSFTNDGVLRNEQTCAFIQKTTSSIKSNVVMTPCLNNDKFNDKWQITEDNQIRHIELDLCLDHRNLNAQDHLYARKCDVTSESQKWEFSN